MKGNFKVDRERILIEFYYAKWEVEKWGLLWEFKNVVGGWVDVGFQG